MNATEALKKLRDDGIKFKVGGLRLYAAGDMTPEQAELLQQYRREITGIVHTEYCLRLEAELTEGSGAYGSAEK